MYSDLAKNRKKIIVNCIIGFILGAIGGWVGAQPLIAAMQIQGVDMVYTGLTDIIHLKLKIMILFGLIGMIAVVGISVPKVMNAYYRSLCILVPTLVVSGCVFYVKRWVLLNAVDMDYFAYPTMVTIKAAGLEKIPLMGLATAFIITLLMMFESKRNQQKL